MKEEVAYGLMFKKRYSLAAFKLLFAFFNLIDNAHKQ